MGAHFLSVAFANLYQRYFSLKIAHAFTVFFGTELQLKTKKRGKVKKFFYDSLNVIIKYNYNQ